MRRSEYQSVRLRGYVRNVATEADEEIRSSSGFTANTEVQLFGAMVVGGCPPVRVGRCQGNEKRKVKRLGDGLFCM